MRAARPRACCATWSTTPAALSSYCFIGAVLGHAGWLLVGPAGEASYREHRAAGAGHGVGAADGLYRAAVPRPLAHERAGPRPASSRWRARCGSSSRRLARAAPLAFGVLNGLLPCPLVYAFAAQAAASGGPLQGLQVMAAFGLGTFPAMLAMGGLGLWLRGGAPPRRSRSTPASCPRCADAAHRLSPQDASCRPPRGRERLGSGPASLLAHRRRAHRRRLHRVARLDHRRARRAADEPRMGAERLARVAQPSARCLPVGRLGRAARHPRRAACLLLLRLRARVPAAPRLARGTRSGRLVDPPRRRRLPGDEHHAVQPAAVRRRVQRRRRLAAHAGALAAVGTGDAAARRCSAARSSTAHGARCASGASPPTRWSRSACWPRTCIRRGRC